MRGSAGGRRRAGKHGHDLAAAVRDTTEDGAGGQVYSSAPAMGVVEWRERAFTPWPLREIAFFPLLLFFCVSPLKS